MTVAVKGFAAFREPVDRRVFAPDFDLWLQLEKPARRLWRAVMKLPDRRGAAPLNDVPPEFYRFPYP